MSHSSSIQLAKQAIARQQWQRVIHLCRSAISNEPSNWEIYFLLGKALQAKQKINSAIAAYKESLELRPDQVEANLKLGKIYRNRRKLAEAEAYFRQAIAVEPQQAELHLQLGITLAQQGQWEQAMACYEQALDLEPKHVKTRFYLGVLYDRLGQSAIAIQYYRQAIRLQPDYLPAYSNLGSVLAKQQKWDRSIEVFRQALKFNPVSETLHNNLGQVYLAQGKSDLALKAFQTALTVNPQMALAYSNLGKLWQQQVNHTQAVKCFQQVVSLQPRHRQAISDCASSLIAQGKFKAAIPYLKQAIALQPEFVRAYCQRVSQIPSDDLLHHAQIACAKFLTTLQQQPDSPAIYNYWRQVYAYLGEVVYQYGAFKQAETYYHQAIGLCPDRLQLYLRLADCLIKQQRWDGAIAVYQMALKLNDADPVILYKLGQILEQQERLTEAIQYYEALMAQSESTAAALGEIFSGQTDKPKLPQAIFATAQDWIQHQLVQDDWRGANYVEVLWSPRTNQPSSQPALIEPATGYQNNADCGGVTCSVCMPRLIESFEPIELQPGIKKCGRTAPLSVESPPAFVVTIPQGRAWIAPQENAWKICNAMAIITPDNYLLGDLSRYYPWYLPGCTNHDLSNHTIFSLAQLPPLEQINGTVAVLSSLSGHVFYHWMIDVLPRFGILQRGGIDLEQIDWFLINEVNHGFQRETLEKIGIPPAKILSSDRHPYVQAERLIVPSFSGHLDWVSWGTIDYLRQTFLSTGSGSYPNKIYVSRSGAKYRQVINEAEVIDLLRERGFTVVWLEKLSVAEQAATFAAAEVIVTPHGGGLTNTVFCRRGTKIIEFFSPNYVRTDYWMISHQLELEHYYLLGESFSCRPLRTMMYQNSLTEDILIDLKQLRSVLKSANVDQV